jgi:hypothetical protein
VETGQTQQSQVYWKDAIAISEDILISLINNITYPFDVAGWAYRTTRGICSRHLMDVRITDVRLPPAAVHIRVTPLDNALAVMKPCVCAIKEKVPKANPPQQQLREMMTGFWTPWEIPQGWLSGDRLKGMNP